MKRGVIFQYADRTSAGAFLLPAYGTHVVAFKIHTTLHLQPKDSSSWSLQSRIATANTVVC
jgi:hypothetical protein